MKRFFKLIAIFLVILMGVCTLFACADDEDYGYYDDYEDEDSYIGDSDTQSSDNIKDNTQNDVDLSQYFSNAILREPGVVLKGNGEDTVTVLMYVNGSNLESDDGEATIDISEVVEAGTSDKVNYLIQTMGTKKWESKFGIASNHSQRYKVVDGGLELVDDSLGQLDCTRASTLADFIKWGKENYPADRYILQFWNHGGGPVYGFGVDEFQSDDASLTIDEMRQALSDGGVYFDFIGMDCCIMSCMEVCMALYDFCDYTILSEEFESGLGWEYTGWVSALNNNSSISTVDLAKIAINDNVSANESDRTMGDKACMSLIDEAMIKILYTSWVDFAYANEDTLLGTNYSQQVKRSKRSHPMLGRSGYGMDYGYGDGGFFSNWDEEEYQLSDYYITDIMAVAQNVSSNEAAALSAAVSKTILYNRVTKENANMTGISVTLPYGDSNFYSSLKTIFNNCGIDSSYVEWLGKFVTAEGAGNFYDYDSEWDDWFGWDQYEDDYDWNDWDYSDDEEYWTDDDFWGWDDCNYDCEEEGYEDDIYYYYDEEEGDYYYYDESDDCYYYY